MKIKKQLLLIILLVSLVSSHAQNLSTYYDESSKKYGFKSSDGTIVIKPVFESTWDKFSLGLVGVRQNGKWGCIDSTGKTIIPFKYSEIGKFLPNVKLARVFLADKVGYKQGYINTVGKEIIPAIYDQLGDEFWANVVRGNLNGKNGIINSDGKIVVPFIYKEYLNFYDGVAIVSRNKKFGGINIENKDVIPFTYDSLINANYDGETLYIVKNNKWGVIDKENKTIIKPFYEKIDLVGSLFRVKQVGGKAYGLYDKSGKIISEHELWTDVGFIENDTYFLYLGTRGKYINSKGETIEKE